MTALRGGTPTAVLLGAGRALLVAYWSVALWDYGLVGGGALTRAGECLAALLGVVALGLWALGEWSSPKLAPARAVLLLLAGMLAIGCLLAVPLPAGWATVLSPVAAEQWSAWRGAGLEPPGWVPLGTSPAALEGALVHGLHVLCVFGVAVPLVRHGNRFLAMLVAATAVLEGVWGLGRVLGEDAPRAWGAVFNPNHHAALTAAGLPLAAVLVLRGGSGDSERLYDGRSPRLFLALLVVLAGLGWLLAISRGAVLAGALVLVPWALVEWRMAALQRPGGGRTGLRMALVPLGVLVAALGVLLGEEVLARLLREDSFGSNSRTGLWAAAWRGLQESRFLGLGFGGTEFALNRHAGVLLTGRPLHAHNDGLQVLVDLGAPGALWFVAAGGLLVHRLRQRRPSFQSPLRRAALAGAAVLLVHAFLDFHLRIPLIAVTCVSLVAMVLAGREALPHGRAGGFRNPSSDRLPAPFRSGRHPA